MTNIFIQHTSEFTAVRRERDGWLLGTVHYSAALNGYTIRVLWPLGVRDTKVYRGEQDAVAAITYHQAARARRKPSGALGGSAGPIGPAGRTAF
jgi:hypothetical protein